MPKQSKANNTSTSANAAVAAILANNKGTGAWPKAAGNKPTSAQLALATALGCKPGTNKWLAMAMYARAGGATQAQVCSVLNGPHLNCWRALPSKATSQRKVGKHFAYFVTVQAKPAAAPTIAA
jgi:hypothetical protein